LDSSLFPAGSLHALATVELESDIPRPAVMLGNFALRRSSMESTLAHCIRYAVRHDDWTNSMLDDSVIDIGRMLQWQLLFPQRTNPRRPFKGRDLFALLFMGVMSLFLCSLPYNDKGELTQMPVQPEWRVRSSDVAKELAIRLISALSKQEKEDYKSFVSTYLEIYVSAIKHRLEGRRQLGLT
jgi:hypothetical protein